MSLDPKQIHEMIKQSFHGRDQAYAPYSKFRVGAAILTDKGEIVSGCNVENASYGAGICAERTAIPKAISLGYRNFIALAVCSDVPAPTTSPCGICRQVIREFCALSMPVIMISSKYPIDSDSPPKALISALADRGLVNTSTLALDDNAGEAGWKDLIKIMTLEELLPMSFGPENLQ